MRNSIRVCLTIMLAISGTADALAQSVPQVGSDETFDVATWNIEWFGASGIGPVNDDLQVSNVADIIAGTGIDVWALQEISDPGRFLELLSSLGPSWSGDLAEISYQQRIGFVYNLDVVSDVEIEHILFDRDNDADTTYLFAGRPPLQLRATVRLPGAEFSTRLITLHAKAHDRDNPELAYDRRAAASLLIESFLESAVPEMENVLFLGDFNDYVEGSIVSTEPSPYVNFADDTTNYRILTEDLTCSFIGFDPCSPIDHIIISDDLIPYYVDNSARALDELPGAISDFEFTTSDHLPVVSSFTALSTSRSESLIPKDFEVSNWPNPFRNEFTVSVTNNIAQTVSICIYDLLGRKVSELARQVLPKGTYHFHWTGHSASASQPANGMYILRVSGEQSSVTRSIVMLPP